MLAEFFVICIFSMRNVSTNTGEGKIIITGIIIGLLLVHLSALQYNIVSIVICLSILDEDCNIHHYHNSFIIITIIIVLTDGYY